MADGKVANVEAELARLRLRLAEAEQTLEAIRAGEVDSLVVEGPEGLRVYALEGTSNSYRVLMESMNEGAATLTEQGVVLYCNSRLARMLDAPLQRVMGSSLRQRVPEHSQDAFDALLRSAEEGEGSAEVALVTMKGEEVPAYLSLSAIEDQGRRVLCVVVTDLRGQKRNEEVVRAERLARSVLEQAAEAIVVCDDQGRITRASKAAVELCACNPLLAGFDEVFPIRLPYGPCGTPMALAAIALSGQEIRAAPAMLCRRDGSATALVVSAAPLQGSAREALGCVVTMTDVSHARRSEELLRQSEERLRLALEGGNQGVWERDLRTQALAWDARCKALFGLRPDEDVSYERFLTLIHPDDRARVLAATRLAEEKRSHYQEEFRVVLPDGGIRWLLARAGVFCSEGEPIRMSGLVVDVTDRRLYDEALREADRRKNQFLAVLSHELRNPLTPIKNSLYILQRAAPGGNQAKRAQEVIDRQVNQLSRLVDDLLDATRISRNKVELKRARLELNELVQGVVQDHRSVFEKAGVRLELHTWPQPVWVLADGARLAQVIGNLLHNAAKFTERAGVAAVSVAKDAAGRAVARVSDTGVGIAPAMLERLFEPFAQGDMTLDRSKGGLGLGLALAKGLIEMHGGEVRAHSAGVGKGAEFTVLLPLEESDLQGLPEGPGARREKESRILIIEDNADAANSLLEALQLGQHVVDVAYDGASGLQKAREFRPDVILCDIGLPGMDGYGVARALRADPALKHVALVALTGYALPEDLERAENAGFDRHLAKPPSMERIEAVIASFPPPHLRGTEGTAPGLGDV